MFSKFFIFHISCWFPSITQEEEIANYPTEMAQGDEEKRLQGFERPGAHERMNNLSLGLGFRPKFGREPHYLVDICEENFSIGEEAGGSELSSASHQGNAGSI